MMLDVSTFGKLISIKIYITILFSASVGYLSLLRRYMKLTKNKKWQ